MGEMGSEWEMVNYEDFVYRRKKRTRIIGGGETAADPTAEAAAAAAAVVELKERKKKMRRTALVKLKEKYKHEIGLWQHFDNTSISMQQHQQQQHVNLNQPSNSILGFPSPPSQSSFLLSHLFSQVEAQEAIIRDFSQLCEVAESLCSVHEEKAKQQFIDLPIWGSPRELMTSLCDD